MDISRWWAVVQSALSIAPLAFLVASCAAISHNKRLNELAVPPSLSGDIDAQRVSLLKEEAAAGDAALTAVLNEEGNPDQVDVRCLARSFGNCSRAELRLGYNHSRKTYVFDGAINVPWKSAHVEPRSSLPRYSARDSIDAYEEYLRQFLDDPPDDLARARSRIDELRARIVVEEKERRDTASRVEQENSAMEHMEAFVHRYPKPDSVEAYEAYLRRSPTDDPARSTALERLEQLRFKPYDAQHTRTALREFVRKYPDSQIAKRLEAQEVLDDVVAGKLKDAVDAIADLHTAVGVGVNLSQYSSRLVDAKIRASRALDGMHASGRASTVAADVRSAIADFEEALSVWNYKVEAAAAGRALSDGGFAYFTDESRVVSWLSRCPQAASGSQPVSLFGGALGGSGKWYPDVAIQSMWSSAGASLSQARAGIEGRE